ncbi:short chain dehydrogenase family protein [Acinetobacter sp. 1396970]|nr:short chain dehydrogenase family protein [Acinetobacter sp. 1396970]
MLNKLSLTGKVALVTGGARSIGAEIVKKLASHGATVAFTYHTSQKQAEELVKEIEFYGGHGLAVQADAGNPEMVIQAVAEVARRFDVC